MSDFGLILTGKTEEHLRTLSDGQTLLHRDAVAGFEAMRAEAGRAGIDLRICSSFRSYEKQLGIWNGKALGQRPVLDAAGDVLNPARVTLDELLLAILRWSAVPGASRHHWGTDIDVYDAAVMPAGYRLRLVPEEYAEGGIFSALSSWLDSEAGRFGFFRPYARDLGGVAPEAWHLSYGPVSLGFFEAYTLDLFRKTVDAEGLELRAELLGRAEWVFERFVRGVSGG